MKSLRTLIVVLMLIVNYGLNLFASKTFAGTTIVNISGLILDSKTLLPISEATIYGEENQPLGVTDANGFFSTKLTLITDKDINFMLIVKKAGYRLYTQKEHWANPGSNLQVTYYFGMQTTAGDSKPFSEFLMNETGNSYDEVKEGFNKVKAKIDFDNKIEKVKAGNDDLFFEIDKNYYLISETGWLKLTSPHDNISINGTKSTRARDINSSVKRSNVKTMTTSANKDIPFEIYTH